MLHRLCEQGKLALLKNVHGGKALPKGQTLLPRLDDAAGSTQ